jgi:regulatory protein
MRGALARSRVPAAVLEATLARLRDLGLLDDAEFARSYVEGRDRTSPRSRRLLRSELRARGVDRAALAEPVSEIDEGDAAYRAGEKRARALAQLAYADFRRRLGDYLLRRGFSYETAAATVARVWEELRGERPVEEDALP